MADEKPLSERHDDAAGAHTDTAHEQHDRGKPAGPSITRANNAKKTASKLRRAGR
ncbi:hypothetical protein [Kitasatospora sp. NPDC017646]|uniref:hypothetical protein n=1 Tax=Kitasatospora sp. NPDC017646 TaxID=3364024 RepID=UPI0037A379AD